MVAISAPAPETNYDNKQSGNLKNVKGSVSFSKVTLAGLCAVCWRSAVIYCPECSLVGYCCFSHVAAHWFTHRSLCAATKSTILKSADCWLVSSKAYSPDEWRSERIRQLNVLQFVLKREIWPYERDLLLFPKCCACLERRRGELAQCTDCSQAWFCRGCGRLPPSHGDWCAQLRLYAGLVRRQAQSGPLQFSLDLSSLSVDNLQLQPDDDIAAVVRRVAGGAADPCRTAVLSQLSSGPLTINHALAACRLKPRKSLTLHLIGAELQYEGSALEAWEFFLLHSLPAVRHLRVVLVGPELRAHTYCSYVRLCQRCTAQRRQLTVEFQDGFLYHAYVSSNKFCRPDLVCAFNPGLHRCTGFNNEDTWPQSIRAALSLRCPFIFTAYTSYEAPLDLQRVQQVAKVDVILKPTRNPYASLKPDRNFISDHEAPLIFKNYYLTAVSRLTLAFNVLHPIHKCKDQQPLNQLVQLLVEDNCLQVYHVR